MKHKHFYTFKAANNFNLGLAMGQKFSVVAKKGILRAKSDLRWKNCLARAKEFLKLSTIYFPKLALEMRGYAEGAGVDFLDLWTMSLEEESQSDMVRDRCTTIVTNGGILIGHNEDFDRDGEKAICVVLKKIGVLKIFELYYYNTLGGNTFSINSYGFAVATNSLSNTDRYSRIGVPRNVIARWLSETRNPEKDFQKLRKIPRSFGYSHTFVNPHGRVWNIEYAAKDAALTLPRLPFAHTNHYLSRLKKIESNDGSTGTLERYVTARKDAKPVMSCEALKMLMNNSADGRITGIMNERTIGKIIVNSSISRADVWMRSERGRGWVTYDVGMLSEALKSFK